jgi:hypothetical protein
MTVRKFDGLVTTATLESPSNDAYILTNGANYRYKHKKTCTHLSFHWRDMLGELSPSKTLSRARGEFLKQFFAPMEKSEFARIHRVGVN